MIVSLWSSIPSALAGYSIAASDPAIDHCGAAATLLHDGTVLVAGAAVYQTGIRFGVTIDKAEIFDPATNTWSDAASMGVTRKGHSAVALASGKVLVVAGSTTTGAYSPPMLYDPASNTVVKYRDFCFSIGKPP
jgi:N-acetylneuraminic acid mutarotase